jgi:gliding motility-associated-like protein
VPFYVCFYLNDFDNERANVQINSLKKGDSSEAVTTDFTIPIEGTHTIYVYVDGKPFSLGIINEENELNNADSLTVDVEPELIVSPNPFTPNDDGFNDESEFNFEQFDVDQPSVKIFDIHGRKVKELDRPSGKIFTWDGRDGNGSHLLPGMYLYIFSDKERARARGCIVIVR